MFFVVVNVVVVINVVVFCKLITSWVTGELHQPGKLPPPQITHVST